MINEKEKIILDKNNNEKEMKKKIDKIEKMEEALKCDSKNDKIIELLEKLEKKENEFKDIKSSNPFNLLKGEKLMSIIFISDDQKLHHSLICKNTDKFAKIECKLYEIYPEYVETENYFINNGVKINKYKSIEENKIKDSDIIILNKINV